MEERELKKIKPMPGKVLVIPYKSQAKKGSLLLTQEKVEYYKVLDAGFDVHEVGIGDLVVIDPHVRGIYRDQDFWIVPEEAIAAVKLHDWSEETE